jgi:hypothetical protein
LLFDLMPKRRREDLYNFEEGMRDTWRYVEGKTRAADRAPHDRPGAHSGHHALDSRRTCSRCSSGTRSMQGAADGSAGGA